MLPVAFLTPHEGLFKENPHDVLTDFLDFFLTK